MKEYQVLGLMSGTSLDGLDMAHCTFWQKADHWKFEIREATTIDYTPEMAEKLKNAIHLSAAEHSRLHIEYGSFLGEKAKNFIEKSDLQIDFIASHGHTSHHRPKDGFTFQLGDGQTLSTIAGQKVVCDFRTLDVTLGGQGAPLVPIGDELLFGDYDFCLNLGGISNISFKKNGKRIAYDIGLANMPLNHITSKIGLAYDEGGTLAASGKVIPKLLDALNTLPYYQLPYPKSTGYEWFTAEVLPLIKASEESTSDLLHTVIVHNCEQIAIQIKANVQKKDSKLLVCGGGAFNQFFMNTLEQKLQEVCEVVIPEKKLINYKEALVFALMGVLKLREEINIFSSVTGAERDSSSGVIFQPL